MHIQYDNRGNLFPPRILELTHEEFEHHFVVQMSDSETRSRLFKNFVDFVQQFQTDITPHFKIWLDGSFISNKLNPRDIDAVFFD